MTDENWISDLTDSLLNRAVVSFRKLTSLTHAESTLSQAWYQKQKLQRNELLG